MKKPVNRPEGVNGGVSASNDNRNRSKNSTPHQLIESLINGDTSALAKIIELKDAPLKSFLIKMLNSREDAEEIAQDVFLRIWKIKERISEDLSFDGLLFRTGYHLAINRIKDKERLHNLLLDEYYSPIDFAESPEEIAVQNDIQGIIDSTIYSMPVEMQRIYTMKYQEKLSNEQIAQTLSIAISTVRVQISRAERRIRDAVYNTF